MTEDEEIKKIINYLEEGKTNGEISELLNSKKDHICYLIRKHDLSQYRNPKIDWNKKKDELRKLFIEDQLSQEEIADILGVSFTTIKNKTREFGFYRDPIVPKKGDVERTKREDRFVERYCTNCGKLFTTYHSSTQKFCSKKCSGEFCRIIPKDEDLLKQLEDNDWNYALVGRLNGVDGNSISNRLKRAGLYKSKQNDWSDVVDLESAQKKVNELGIRTPTELYKNYGGLADRLVRFDLISDISYSGIDFDSSWEESLFNYIADYSDILGYLNISHNIKLDKDCKYERPLIFDIVIDYGRNLAKTVIEVQGITHFKNIHGTLEDVLMRDEIKYNYCITHDINILYFTYDKSLVDTYDYPHYVYTDENLLLDKLKEFSLPSI